MKYIPRYTRSELEADTERRARGESLTCPNCSWTDPEHGRLRLYDIYVERGPGGAIAHSYRLCKVCGFAQDTDGGEPYRVWLSRHDCRPGPLPDGERRHRCRHCRATLDIVGGVARPHRCGKYLRQGDTGYCCATCGEWLGPESSEPLPGDRRREARRSEGSREARRSEDSREARPRDVRRREAPAA